MPESVALATLTTAQCGRHRVAVVTFSRADGRDAPAVLGPEGLQRALAAVTQAAAMPGIMGIVLTGTGRTFLAGADLTMVAGSRDPADGRRVGQLGHQLVAAIMDSPVPTIAWINGTALGGGLEVALACSMRLAAAGVRQLGLPETHLGLIPGWGGCHLLPHLVGPAVAGEVIITNPLRDNTTLTAAQALELGIVDRVVDGGTDLPTEQIAALLDAPLRLRAPEAGAPAVGPGGSPRDWEAELNPLAGRVARATAAGRPAPALALELLLAAESSDRATAFAAEEEALAELVPTPALHNALYAVELLRRSRPRPTQSPFRTIGIIGGGLMATQLATLFAVRLGAAVVLQEVDEARAARARDLLAVAQVELAGRLPEEELARLADAVRVGTGWEGFERAEFVLEAVFEDLAVKRAVLAQAEPRLRQDAILATNTSALSVTEMAAALQRPERMVGAHFFNPVAAMPLVEVVRTPRSHPAAVDAVRAMAHAAGKVTIDVADAPGFVVNRVLVRLLGEVLGALEEGTPVRVAASALDPIGLPMGPFQLLQLVGPPVAAHVLAELRAGLGERFPHSPGLEAIVREGASFLAGPPRAATPPHPELQRYFPPARASAPGPGQLLERVQLALAEEIHLMLAEGVADLHSIDLGMLTGAGFPLHRGGITPWLDQVGASERTGGHFHPAGV